MNAIHPYRFIAWAPWLQGIALQLQLLMGELYLQLREKTFCEAAIRASKNPLLLYASNSSVYAPKLTLWVFAAHILLRFWVLWTGKYLGKTIFLVEVLT
ncbi:MAG: hypothetical protein AAGM67_08900 [Bacteroidota bacterium]